jgi:hypothetical protein
MFAAVKDFSVTSKGFFPDKKLAIRGGVDNLIRKQHVVTSNNKKSRPVGTALFYPPNLEFFTFQAVNVFP